MLVSALGNFQFISKTNTYNTFFQFTNALIAGEFGIVYRARLTRSTLRKTESEIVAVKTIKGKNMIAHGVHCMSTTDSCLPVYSQHLVSCCSACLNPLDYDFMGYKYSCVSFSHLINLHNNNNNRFPRFDTRSKCYHHLQPNDTLI